MAVWLVIGAVAWFAAFAFGVQWGALVMLGGVGLMAADACDELRRIKKRLPEPAPIDESTAARMDRRGALLLGGALVVIIGVAIFLAGRV